MRVNISRNEMYCKKKCKNKEDDLLKNASLQLMQLNGLYMDSILSACIRFLFDIRLDSSIRNPQVGSAEQ